MSYSFWGSNQASKTWFSEQRKFYKYLCAVVLSPAVAGFQKRKDIHWQPTRHSCFSATSLQVLGYVQLHCQPHTYRSGSKTFELCWPNNGNILAPDYAERCPFQKYPIRHSQGTEWWKLHLFSYHRQKCNWKRRPQILPNKRDDVNNVHNTNLPFSFMRNNFPLFITEPFRVEKDFI